MKNALLLSTVALLGAFAVAHSAQAADAAPSVCSITENFDTETNPTSGCDSYDYLVYFSTSCDGAKAINSKPVMYQSGCANKKTPQREQVESTHLLILITQGYHIVGNYRLSDTQTVYTMEK